MNGEPKRWLDDENAPPGVRGLLRGSQRALPIDAGTRARVGRRVARLSILPVSLLTWLGAKSALAALGAAAGLATVGVATLGVMATREDPKPVPVAPAARHATHAPKNTNLPPVTEPASPPESEVLPEPVVSAQPSNPPAVPSAVEQPASAGGLAEETEFLERARRLLKTDPAFALLLVREQDTRFPKPKLRAERTLIEIEALYRSGRHAEARALAERQLAGDAGDLYTERVRALLERIDQSR